MLTITSAAQMTALSREARRAGKRLGFVPTMGALHQGHLSLIHVARTRCALTAVSVFVNPTQFGPQEDYEKYPRNLAADSALLGAENVDYLFCPSVEEIYPRGACTWVEVEGLSDRLDGRSRPGHFRGVTTVVSKLFNIVEPDLAFFGQKDAAQAAIIRKMAADLHFDIEIVVCPIVREPDGLAMSSRNVYLDPAQRRSSTALYRALMRIQTLVDRGQTDSVRLASAGREVIAEEPSVRLDYLELIDPDTLEPVPNVLGGALVAVAAYVGSTRLIDNLLIPGKGSAVPVR